MSKTLQFCESCLHAYQTARVNTNHVCSNPRCDCRGLHVILLPDKEKK